MCKWDWRVKWEWWWRGLVERKENFKNKNKIWRKETKCEQIEAKTYHSTTKWTQSVAEWTQSRTMGMCGSKTDNERTLVWTWRLAPLEMRNVGNIQMSTVTSFVKGSQTKLRRKETTNKATSVKNRHQTHCHNPSQIETNGQQQNSSRRSQQNGTKILTSSQIWTPLLSTQQRNEHDHDGNVWLPKLEMNEPSCLGLQCSLLWRWEVRQHSNVHRNKLGEGESHHTMEEETKQIKKHQSNEYTSNTLSYPSQIETKNNNNKTAQGDHNKTKIGEGESNTFPFHSDNEPKLNHDGNTCVACHLKLEIKEQQVVLGFNVRSFGDEKFDNIQMSIETSLVTGESNHPWEEKGNKTNKATSVKRIHIKHFVTSISNRNKEQQQQQQQQQQNSSRWTQQNGRKIMSASQYQHLSFPLNNEMNTITIGNVWLPKLEINELRLRLQCSTLCVMRNSATFKCPLRQVKWLRGGEPFYEESIESKHQCERGDIKHFVTSIWKSKQRTTTPKQLKAITTKWNKNIERLSISNTSPFDSTTKWTQSRWECEAGKGL